MVLPMAADGHSSSYWASSFISPGEVVEFALEFGSSTKLQMLDILWEFAAEQFSISTTNDGVQLERGVYKQREHSKPHACAVG
jgi:hypothetical protein